MRSCVAAVITAQYDLLTPEAGSYWNANQSLWAPDKTMFVPADVADQVSAEDVSCVLL